MRTVLYDILSGDAPVVAVVGDRIYQGGALTETPQTKPFLVLRMGAENTALRGRGAPGERALPKQIYAQVWAHDDSGDYQRIDSLLGLVRTALENVEHFGNLLEIRWIEGSRDFRDADLNTITKYSRYLLTTSR